MKVIAEFEITGVDKPFETVKLVIQQQTNSWVFLRWNKLEIQDEVKEE